MKSDFSIRFRKEALMAELVREDGNLVLKLSTVEKAEGVHGDITVPITSVVDVEVVDDIIHALHGLKLPGSRLPGVFAMGTFVSTNETTFAVIHHQHHRGVRVNLKGERFDALMIGLVDPETVKASIGL